METLKGLRPCMLAYSPQAAPRATRPAHRARRALASRALLFSRSQRGTRAASTDVEAAPVEAAEAADEPQPEPALAKAVEEQTAPQADARRRFAPAGGARRGRPPREIKFRFEDLSVGQEVEGVITTTVAYGAFCDIKSSTDGLIHISQLQEGFVSTVTDVVQPGQTVTARIIGLDSGTNRISLTLKPADSPEREARRGPPRGERGPPREDYGGDSREGSGDRPGRGKVATRGGGGEGGKQRQAAQPLNIKVGDEVTGKVSRVAGYGAFVDLEGGVTGLLHAKEMVTEDGSEANPAMLFPPGKEVTLRVVSVNERTRRVDLSARSEEERAADEAAEKGGITTAAQQRRTVGGLSTLQSAFSRVGIAPSVMPEPAKAKVVIEDDEAEEEADGAEAGGSAAAEEAADAVPDAVEDAPEVTPEAALSDTVAAAEPELVPEAPPAQAEAVTEALGAALDAAEALDQSLNPTPAEPEPSADPEPAAAAEPEPELAVAAEAEGDAAAPGTLEAATPDAAADVAESLTGALPAEPAAAPKAAADPALDPVPGSSPEEASAIEEPPAPAPEPELVAAAPDAAAVAAPPAPEATEEPAPAAGAVPAAAEVPPPAQAEEPPAPAAVPEPETQPELVAAAPDAAPVAAPPAPEAAEVTGAEAKISAKLVKQLRDKSGAGMMDCKKALAQSGGDFDAAAEYLRKKGLASADKKAGRVAAEGAIASYIHAGSRLGVLVEVNCETDFVARGDKFRELVADLAMQIAACESVAVVATDDVEPAVVAKETEIEMQKEDIVSKPEAIRPKIVAGRVAKLVKAMALMEQPFIKDTEKTVETVIKEATAAIGEKISVRRFSRYVLGEGMEKRSADLAAEVAAQTAAMEAAAAAKAAMDAPTPAAEAAPAAGDAPKAEISAKLVKQLRDKSGAGMMDCKKALGESGGDFDAAVEYLRKKGLASADKKAGRVAAEGAIGSYIHAGSRLGVLVEVNCETDFVARGDKFRELVADLAMQIAASPGVTGVAVEDVPAEELERERAIELQKEDILSKPEAIRGKIVDGRVAKIAKERALLEQPFIKDTSKSVAEHIKAAVAAIGENIQVRRFSRYMLGEGMEKRSTDFAAEVAAQTGQA